MHLKCVFALCCTFLFCAVSEAVKTTDSTVNQEKKIAHDGEIKGSDHYNGGINGNNHHWPRAPKRPVGSDDFIDDKGDEEDDKAMLMLGDTSDNTDDNSDKSVGKQTTDDSSSPLSLSPSLSTVQISKTTPKSPSPKKLSPLFSSATTQMSTDNETKENSPSKIFTEFRQSTNQPETMKTESQSLSSSLPPTLPSQLLLQSPQSVRQSTGSSEKPTKRRSDSTNTQAPVSSLQQNLGVSAQTFLDTSTQKKEKEKEAEEEDDLEEQQQDEEGEEKMKEIEEEEEKHAVVSQQKEVKKKRKNTMKKRKKVRRKDVSPQPLMAGLVSTTEGPDSAKDADTDPDSNKKTTRNRNANKRQTTAVGPPGERGPQGPPGPPGPRGERGPPGNCSCEAQPSGPTPRMEAAVTAVLTEHFGPAKDVIVPFNLELIDSADNYDNVSGVFFCGIPGTYVISLYLMSHPGSKVNARIFVNSRPVAALWADDNKESGFYPSSSIQTISRLAFGDQVYVMLVDGGYGESWVHANYNVFTIFLLYEDLFPSVA